MQQRMRNTLIVTVRNADLMSFSSIEFYVKQNGNFFEYAPRVISSTQMAVDIPYEDAMKLDATTAKLQFAYTDERGTPCRSGVLEVRVKELLKEAGYDPL